VKDFKLLTPGPVDCYEDVLAALATPAPPHYGDEWLGIYGETIELLRQVFRTKNDLFMMVAPGTGALEAGMASLVATGERLLLIDNGYFGHRLGVVARSHGIETSILNFPLGQPADAQAVRERLRQENDLQAVAVVHHETSTTVINPVRDIAEAAHEHDLPVIVDAVSSLGGMPVPVDEWGLDICVAVANKCLETPPALAPVSVSERAWRVMDSKPKINHGWFYDLKVWRDYAVNWAWHPYPTTMPTNNIIALRTSLRKLVAEGLPAHFARYARATRWVREGLRALGFEMFVDDAHAAPLVSAARAMPDFAVSSYQSFLKDEHHLIIAGGLEELAGKIFRVGTMGKAASREYVMDFLFATEEFLRRNGRTIPIGECLRGVCEEP
jgi:alanine-glyoxylate transaminase / serine-glyoxylate transaminase / serine-pyruvate transaminase